MPQTLGICLTYIIISHYFMTVSSNVIVELQEGKIDGQKLTCSKCNEDIYAFEGIPYAKPPLKNLRFSLPEPVQSWDGIKVTRNKSSSCVHLKVRCSLANALCVSGTEDCLYLNVYSKSYVNNDSPCDHVNPSNVPVLVVIPGLDFASGSADDIVENPGLLVSQGIVLVTFNYRLGPFGFLSSDSRKLPGNYGLHDQLMVLKWVRRNIEAFGGSPDKVTVMGTASGAVSVHYLIMSPLAKGLFQKAISQSGSALCPWTLSSKNKSKFKSLCEYLMCPVSDCLSCLRELPADQIALATSLMWKWKKFPMVFLPGVDQQSCKPILPDYPLEILSSGAFNQVPWLIGINEETCVSFIASKIDNYEALKDFWSCFDKVCPLALNMNEEHCQEVKKLYYIPREERSHKTTRLNNMMELLFDRHFVACMDLSARLHSFFAPVFFYVTHYGCNIDIENLVNLQPGDSGNFTHSLEHHCLFGTYLKNMGQMGDTEESCRIISNTWINFIKYGYPTPSGNFPSWPLYQFDNPKYYFITPSPEVRQGYRKERMEMWNNLYLQWTPNVKVGPMKATSAIQESQDCLNRTTCPNLDLEPINEKQIFSSHLERSKCFPAVKRLMSEQESKPGSPCHMDGPDPFVMKYSCKYDKEEAEEDRSPCRKVTDENGKSSYEPSYQGDTTNENIRDSYKHKRTADSFCCVAFDELVAISDPEIDGPDSRKYFPASVDCNKVIPDYDEWYEGQNVCDVIVNNSYCTDDITLANMDDINKFKEHFKKSSSLVPKNTAVFKTAREVINNALTKIIVSNNLKTNSNPEGISLMKLIAKSLDNYLEIAMHDIFVVGA